MQRATHSNWSHVRLLPTVCVADVAANDEIFRFRKRTKRQRVYGTTGQATEKAKQTKSKHGNTKIKIGKTFVSLSS